MRGKLRMPGYRTPQIHRNHPAPGRGGRRQPRRHHLIQIKQQIGVHRDAGGLGRRSYFPCLLLRKEAPRHALLDGEEADLACPVKRLLPWLTSYLHRGENPEKSPQATEECEAISPQLGKLLHVETLLAQ